MLSEKRLLIGFLPLIFGLLMRPAVAGDENGPASQAPVIPPEIATLCFTPPDDDPAFEAKLAAKAQELGLPEDRARLHACIQKHWRQVLDQMAKKQSAQNRTAAAIFNAISELRQDAAKEPSRQKIQQVINAANGIARDRQALVQAPDAAAKEKAEEAIGRKIEAGYEQLVWAYNAEIKIRGFGAALEELRQAGAAKARDMAAAASYAPPAGLAPAEADPTLLARITETFAALGAPPDAPRLTAEIHERWTYAQEELGRKWKSLSSAPLGGAKLVELADPGPEEQAATVRLLKSGAWVYVPGKREEALPKSNAGIAECWQKVFLSTRAGKGTMSDLVFYSSDPKAFPSWQQLQWDDEIGAWVVVTRAQARMVRDNFDKWLAARCVEYTAKAAQCPDQAQLKMAQGRAERLKANLEKRAQATEQEQKEADFRIKSDTGFVFERLVWAFDAAFHLRAAELTLADFRQNPGNYQVRGAP